MSFDFRNPPPDARFINIDQYGRKVYRWRGMTYYESEPIPPPTTADLQGGVYSPDCGRQGAYAGRKDWRNTRWFAEAVREMRQIRQTNYRAVTPGPQRMR